MSVETQAKIEIEGFNGGEDLSETLSRAKFEELNMDLFKRTLVPVENVLKEAKLQKDDIHEVLLVGGSTRIPKIQQLLKDYFRGKEPRRGIQPDEAVAYGMAVQGREEPEEGCTYIIMDIAPLSLGLETAGGAMTVMIPRNTLLPTKKVRTFSTYHQSV
uniref:Uncharacterized protein n=1 Tax=Arcella intermedia TaxID=1963864 RepID=A0A6B2LMG3_9EUKA